MQPSRRTPELEEDRAGNAWRDGAPPRHEVCTTAVTPMSLAAHELGRDPLPPYLAHWHGRPIRELIEHITRTHHTFTREALASLGQATPAVVRAHRERHPELVVLSRRLEALGADLQPHLLKEERILFPFVLALEEATEVGGAFPF